MKFNNMCLVAALATGLAAPAFAQGVEYVETIDGWDVMIDTADGLGCLIHAEFDDGTSFRIGSSNDGEAGYLLALNEDWDFFEAGTDYAIGLTLSGELYEGTGKGALIGGVPGLDIFFDSEEFSETLVSGGVIEVLLEDESLFALDLGESTDAIIGLVACEMQRQAG